MSTVADESPPQASSASEEVQPENRYKNLRPRKPGDPPLNPNGLNGWKKAQARIAKIMNGHEPGSQFRRRLDEVIMAAYQTARIPGIKGAPDRKLLIEQSAGKAKQQVELSGEVKTGHVLVIPMPGAGTDEDMERVAAEAQDQLKAEVAK